MGEVNNTRKLIVKGDNAFNGIKVANYSNVYVISDMWRR